MEMGNDIRAREGKRELVTALKDSFKTYENINPP